MKDLDIQAARNNPDEAARQQTNISKEDWAKKSDDEKHAILKEIADKKQSDGETINRVDSSNGLVGGLLGDIGDALKSLVGIQDTSYGYVDENGEFVYKTCFVTGTLVRVAPASEGSRSSASPLIEKRGENGELQYYREIQDIRVGDEVLTYNEKTARMEYRRVTETFVHQTKLIFEISYRNGEKLETTWNHPFYIAGRGWVQAKDLRVNDRSLAVRELETPAIAFAARFVPTAMAAVMFPEEDEGNEIASIRQVHRDDTVYNLEVDETHAYFVGEGGVLVHNYEPDNGPDLSTGPFSTDVLPSYLWNMLPEWLKRSLDDGYAMYGNNEGTRDYYASGINEGEKYVETIHELFMHALHDNATPADYEALAKELERIRKENEKNDPAFQAGFNQAVNKELYRRAILDTPQVMDSFDPIPSWTKWIVRLNKLLKE